MRNYYYNNANFAVYTEIEKSKSRFPKHRFELIGQFKNRTDAESHCEENIGGIEYNAKRI